MKLCHCVSFFVLSQTFHHGSALPTFAGSIDMDAPVSLGDLKQRSNVAGHDIPLDHLVSLVKKSLDEGISRAPRVKKLKFDPKAQLIDVHGEHKYIPPDFDAGETRGPCPGLNSMANHGYLPHDGVASISQIVEASNKVWGMGKDIATILAVYGVVLGGNPVSLNPSVSIGGPSKAANAQNLLGNIGGLLGKPRGATYTHNAFEVDGSNTRNDLYDPIGDNSDVNMTYFINLFNKQKDAEVPNYSLDVMMDYSLERLDEAISFNPYFVYLPWSGWFVRNAAIIFSGRLFVNCSEEYPEGILGKEGLKSIYGITGPDDNMVYHRGGDRIPENYYRRPDDYTFTDGFRDLMTSTVIKRPRLFSIGGNVNGVNTFAGLNFSDITGGAFNSAQLLEGNNFLCFVFQFVREASPNLLSSLYASVDLPLSKLTNALGSVFVSLNCPAYKDLRVGGTDLFSYFKATYPGAAMSNGGI